MTRIVLAMVLAAGLGTAPDAAGADVTITPITRDGQLQVTVDLSDGFTPEVRDGIRSGLATTFSYTVELRRGSAAWFDVTVAQVTVSATVRFDNLTRRYEMSRTLNGRMEQGHPRFFWPWDAGSALGHAKFTFIQ